MINVEVDTGHLGHLGYEEGERGTDNQSRIFLVDHEKRARFRKGHEKRINKTIHSVARGHN